MSIFAKIFALIMAVLAFFGCTKPEKPDTPAPNSYEVNGDKVEFCFDANPTTGFEWKAEIEGDCIVLSDSKYVPDKTDGIMAGVGGLQYYYFTASHEGSATVTFTYYRPFEDMGNNRIFVAKVSVDDSNNVTVTDFCETNN